MQTIVQYLIQRLAEEGVKEVFGLPGDYNFEIIDAVEDNPNIKWIGCCNELNAAYASDGYARLNGLGVCVTAYGVGELSAMNGIAGCYAQNVPVVHIVGAPNTQDMYNDVIVHHSLGNGEWDAYMKAFENVTDYAVMINEDTAYSDINIAINTALKEKKPVYIAIPRNLADTPIRVTPMTKPVNGKNSPDIAEYIISKLKEAKKPVLMLDSFVYVHNLKDEVEKLVNKLQIPAMTTEMGKGTINESNPFYANVFAGNLLNPVTAKLYEESDCILALGLVWADFNVGHFSIPLKRESLINITKDSVEMPDKIFELASPKELIEELTEKAPSLNYEYEKPQIGFDNTEFPDDTQLKCDNLFPMLQDFFEEDDIIVTETGLSNLGIVSCKIPDNTRMVNQFLYSSIGWALPAAFGAQMAKKDRRLILLSGDGSAQLTIQELSSIYRNNLKPIIFILNNNGYTIERVLSASPDDLYNNIPDWDWEVIPRSFCGDSYFKRICTTGELKEAMNEAKNLEKPAFIELMLEEMDLPIYARQIAEFVKSKKNK